MDDDDEVEVFGFGHVNARGCIGVGGSDCIANIWRNNSFSCLASLDDVAIALSTMGKKDISWLFMADKEEKSQGEAR